MSKARTLSLAFAACLLVILVFVRSGYSVEPVPIEFFYYEPPLCTTCSLEAYETWLHNNQTVNAIHNDYGSRVSVVRLFFYSSGEKELSYGISPTDWNTIVVNYERVFKGYVNETYLREILDAYLTNSIHDVAITKVIPSSTSVKIGEKVNINTTAKNYGVETENFSVSVYFNETLIGTQLITSLGPKNEVSMIFVWDTTNQTTGSYVIRVEAQSVLGETVLANNNYVYDNIELRTPSSDSALALFFVAFSLGFFETFSPCLIILLSFVLSYTIGKSSHFKESFSRVMTFGAGFLSATLILALAFGLAMLSMPTLQLSLTWVVSVFAIIFGLNLLGVLRFPSRMSIQSKPLIKKLARKYVFTYAGLFLLGFVFYFLDPCIAPIFVSMMPLLLPETLFFVILVFLLGAAIPFVGIGIFAGSVSKLARSTYRHQSKIRAISGLILISYALYLIVFVLLKVRI